ncbi:nucleotide sugar dehydrogenase [Candidatus Pelagibacter bacterium]|nr:nucleotide sugar dehydrogenase [Candidatus Pelagibacter bacterium]
MKKIVIQGLGYVGLAMMTFCAGAKKNNKYLYKVIGIEKNSAKGLNILNKINSNQIPKIVDDNNFLKFYSKLVKDKRIKASIDNSEYSDADIVFVCSNCDFDFVKKQAKLKDYINNINQISKKIKNNCLLIIQSTLPPGTTDKILTPLIRKNLNKRGIKNFYLCHSFERITPGKDYYFSMKNSERIVGGKNQISLKITKKIFRDIFNLDSNKIIEFDSPTESETCKIIENSYRATNIAFIEEWRKFCAKNNLDLEKILRSIRQRKTHNNIMRSGIGVGGYCLTKDPLFAKASSKQVLQEKFDFPLSSKAVVINQKMTFDIMSEINDKFNKKIFGKNVLLIGVSYRQDTNDTRYSPAEEVFDFFKKMKCKTSFYDPIVNYWNFTKSYSIKKKNLKNFDVYVFLIKHRSFKKLNIAFKKNSLILDLNHVLEKNKRLRISKSKNYSSYFIGSK